MNGRLKFSKISKYHKIDPMPNKKVIRSLKEFPDTHNFVYENKLYPFKINFFNLSSNYFVRNSEEIQYNKDINLIEEDIGKKLNIQEQTIIDIINYVQHEEITVDNENAIILHFLSKKYEIEELLEATSEYILSNCEDLAIQILSICEYDSSLNDDTYEDLICHKMSQYINKEELLSLPVSKLHRIMSKYSRLESDEVASKEMNDFILKKIEMDGREASILLSFARFDPENIEFIETLVEQYSTKVDFSFFDFSILSTFLEIKKRQEKENDELSRENLRVKTENKEKDRIISSLESKLKLQESTSDMEIRKKNEEISSLEIQIEQTKNKKEEKILSLRRDFEKIEKDKEEEISSLKKQILVSSRRYFRTEMSKEGPGILSKLKTKQKTPFDRLFIASQSSSDIYTLLLPHSNDDFCTTNSGNFFIEFELEAAVTISGVKIFSSDASFPKSFDISVEGETVKSVREARELNGKYKDMTVSFAPVRGRKVRFTQTGPNWDKNTNYLWIKGIELLSTESRYSRGVFATLVGEIENEDPHKCPVIISASNFDFNCFYSINAPRNTSTYNYENSWFQVELTRGTAVLNGFRLKRCNPDKLRSYKVICTDDSSKPESSWTTLIEINEETINEHEVLDIYEFPHPSPPTRFVRLVQTGKNWNDDLCLMFIHFDLFGEYF
ncbi:hypothetical protein M9Y10_008848 [Tritrichomonas musculus]|uniref:F5/8 type C domain-containing protein n=1 Tax=Tritrichomonas musculus TaxID=1915356 RepID=A0ABR2IZ82_9EUKA